MAIDKNSGTIINIEEAKKYTKSLRENFPDETKAYFVGLDKVKLILEQENCLGFRIYNGYNKEIKKRNLVIIGVDKAKKDMTNGIIIEKLITCPPICDENSILLTE